MPVTLLKGFVLLAISVLMGGDAVAQNNSATWTIADLCDGPSRKRARLESDHPRIDITATFGPCETVFLGAFIGNSAPATAGGTITSGRKMNFARVRVNGPLPDVGGNQITHATVTLFDDQGNFTEAELDTFGTVELELTSENGTFEFGFSATRPVRVREVLGILKPDCEDFSDEDNDGLPHAWEVCGLNDVPRESGMPVVCRFTPCDLSLKDMGALPNRPDIFVEIDWMGRGGHRRSHRPSPRAIEMIVQAFKEQGISLHLDAGPKHVMDPFTGKTWEDLSESNRVTHVTKLGCCANASNCSEPPFQRSSTGCPNPSLNDIKDEPNGQKLNFEIIRRAVFHYGLMAHRIDDTSTGGISRSAPASDFLVSLGNWNAETGAGAVIQQAGVIMHELGHNLRLFHGGEFEPNRNNKANYLSVMNDLFATQGLLAGGGILTFVDYSRRALPDLDERNLDERINLAGDDPVDTEALEGAFTTWTCPHGQCEETGEPCLENVDCPGTFSCLTGTCPLTGERCAIDAECLSEICLLGLCSVDRNPCNSNSHCTPPNVCIPTLEPITRSRRADLPINWDCDAFELESSVEVDTNRDIRHDILLGAGTDDWNRLVYKGGWIGTAICPASNACDPPEPLVQGIAAATPQPVGIFPPPPGSDPIPPIPPGGGVPFPETLTLEHANALGPELRVLVLPPEDRSVLPDSETPLSFFVVNKGVIADTYDITATGTPGWFNLAAVPESLTLAAGESGELSIVVTPPSGTALGDLGEITVSAGSQNFPHVHSEGDTFVDVFGCGDANADSSVDAADVALMRLHDLESERGFLSAVGMERCSVFGGPLDCDLLDIVVLRRWLAQQELAPGLQPVCAAAAAP